MNISRLGEIASGCHPSPGCALAAELALRLHLLCQDLTLQGLYACAGQQLERGADGIFGYGLSMRNIQLLQRIALLWRPAR